MFNYLTFSVVFCCLGVVLANAGSPAELDGYWRTVRHGATVQIQDCGDDSPCASLVSVSREVSGGQTRDERNRDRSLRTRPLVGVPIFWGFSKSDVSWTDGRLYNPETGQTFRASLKQIEDDKLQVQGCLGPFCRKQVWTRIAPSNANSIEDEE